MIATAEPTGPEDWSDTDNPIGPRQRVNPPDPATVDHARTVGPDHAPERERHHGAARGRGADGPPGAKAAGPEGPPSVPTGSTDSPPLAPLRMVVRTFDRWAEQPFTRLRGNKAADRLFYGASEAANFSILWHAMAWTPFLLRPSPHRLIRAVGTSGSLVVESVLVNGPVKSAFRRTRPVLEQGHLHVHRLRTPRSTSFPSGHASAAMVAALVMGRDRHWLPRWLLLAAASVVSASRVHVRIHHPSDVVGGAMIGWLLGRVLRRMLP